MIYFDNAAITLKKPQCVIDTVAGVMTTLGNVGRGVYSSSLDASRMVCRTRRKLAVFFGCTGADHVVFTSNATEALNIALCGAIPDGAHVITTELEHNSVLRPLYYLEKEKNVSLSFLPTDENGSPVYGQLESMIRPDTKAIVCTHASNVTGVVLNLAYAGKIAKKNISCFLSRMSLRPQACCRSIWSRYRRIFSALRDIRD